MSGKIEIGDIVYSPTQSADLTVRYAREISQTNALGITTGISDLDRFFIPLRPGDLMTVLGVTSHYKSGFMDWMARSALLQCSDDEVVVKVTWEQSVEEDTLRWMSRVTGVGVNLMVRGLMGETEWQALMQGYKARVNTNLWIVGHSTIESSNAKRARPRMTMTDAMQAISQICYGITDKKYKVKMVVLDYLQRMRFDKNDGDTRREQVMEAVNKAKDIGIQFGAGVILGSQVGREVLDRDMKLPQIDDGQESSAIEQYSDKVVSLWLPAKTEAMGKVLNFDGRRVRVNSNLLIAGILKQKLGSAPHAIPLYVDLDNNMIGNLAEDVPDYVPDRSRAFNG